MDEQTQAVMESGERVSVATTKKTIIVFSGDFDKMMAAFIIANGAAAMGDDVTMFFTFWGLNALRRPEKVQTKDKKSTLQAMFGKMMPRGAGKLGLSKMNFAGMGAPMMKKVMKQQNVMSLDELIASAKEQGVKLVACTMSMDVMGFKEEELMDGLEYAGVGAYLGEADEANVNLFI
jgi:peroxiredoxin family protein